MQLSELAARLGVALRGNGAADRSIDSVAAASQACAQQLIFAENEVAAVTANASAAGAVVISGRLAGLVTTLPALVADHPRLVFACAAALLRAETPCSGISDDASVSTQARVGRDVSIGAGAVVAEDVAIGAGTLIGSGAVIGAGVTIGDGCHIYPRVVIYPGVALGHRVIVHAGAVLGSDGFGYVRDAATGAYIQFPQQGRLVIEDDVEIGANTTIDRGALEETRIGSGTKLDNLVHIGHNVTIGRNVVIAAQTGISGSSTIGEGAIVGGQVGIADHVQIGEGAILGAQAGIPSGKRIHGPGIVFWGTPARPIKNYLKELATLARLTRTKRT